MSAWAADFQQGVQAYQEGNYGVALDAWRPLAEAGDPRALFALGKMHADGNGVETDQAEATRWYRLAAEQGYADAQYNLGVRYHNGKGTEKDPQAAVRWYRLAAKQGHVTAQNNLGLLYVTGIGVAQDRREGARWIMRAARAGSGPARRNTPRLIEDMPRRQIGGSNVNIRSAPSTGAQVILQARQGAPLRVLGSRDDWTEVLFPDNYLVGWVASFLLQQPGSAPVPAAPVAAASEAQDSETGRLLAIARPVVNVRAAPTIDAEIVKKASQGTRVQVIKTEGDWTRVVFEQDRSIGWVASYLLTDEP